MSLVASENEAHSRRQFRQAEKAFRGMDGRTRNALIKHSAEPLAEASILFDKQEHIEPLDDHDWHIQSAELLPGECLSDPATQRIQAEAVKQTLSVIIPAICEGFDRGPALAEAVLAVLNGEHRNPTNGQLDPVNTIARYHGAAKEPLRKMLQGLRHII